MLRGYRGTYDQYRTHNTSGTCVLLLRRLHCTVHNYKVVQTCYHDELCSCSSSQGGPSLSAAPPLCPQCSPRARGHIPRRACCWCVAATKTREDCEVGQACISIFQTAINQKPSSCCTVQQRPRHCCCCCCSGADRCKDTRGCSPADGPPCKRPWTSRTGSASRRWVGVGVWVHVWVFPP